MSAFFIYDHNPKEAPITSSKQAFKHIYPKISKKREEVWVSCLSSSKEVISSRCLFRGSVDQCMVHPREIFYFAIQNLSSSFLIFHSHPSGDTQPSKEDISLTKKINKASKFMGIAMLDHIIVGKDSFYSFLDEGLL